MWAIGVKLFSGTAIGTARGAIEVMEDELRTRRSVGAVAMKELQSVHLRLAESSAEVDAAWELMLADCAEATALVEAEAEISLDVRARWRRNDAFAALGLEMDSLPCQCGTEGCEAAGRRPARDTTIYVIAERAAIAEAVDASDPDSTHRLDDAAQRDREEGARDRGESAETGVTGAVEADGAGASEPDVTGAPGCKAPKAPPAFIFGAGVTPNWLPTAKTSTVSIR